MKRTSTVKTIINRTVERDDLKALIDNTTDLMWSVDSNFKIITCNLAFKEKIKILSNKTANKGSGILPVSFRFIAFYERAFSGKSFVEIEYLNDPVELWLEIAFSPIRKGEEIIGISCYARDITRIKNEEHRLRLLESVVSNATDSIMITETTPLDGAGPKIVYVNDALIKMTGYKLEEIIGKTPLMFQGPKSDKKQLDRSIECLARSKPCEIEIVNYKKNGEEFWIHIAIAPIVDSTALFTHFISIGRDVTERVKNVEAIREQNQKLRDIAWIQSHDVRGPLARIKGLVNLLSANSHSENETQLIDYLRASSNELDDVLRKIMTKAEEVYGFCGGPMLPIETVEEFIPSSK